MLSLLIAVALLQAPEAPAAAPPAIHESNLPKDDYGLVAWCHGALAGQLELDGVAKADMEKIEGKAKVAARAKSDAEMEKDRRQYLKDYEHALAAAEAASPVAIHQRGVQAEQQGYKLWSATRNKEPIWRMLDWGIWDPNDAGCGDAAKRLYNRSTLLGVALKTSDSPASDGATEDPAAKAEEAPTKPLVGYVPRKAETAPFMGDAAPATSTTAAEALSPAPADTLAAPATDQHAAGPMVSSQDTKTVAATDAAATQGEATEAMAKAVPPVKAAVAKKPAKPVIKPSSKPAARPVVKPTKTGPAGMSAEDIRAAIARGKAETGVPAEMPPPAPADKPIAKPDGGLELRGSLHP